MNSTTKIAEKIAFLSTIHRIKFLFVIVLCAVLGFSAHAQAYTKEIIEIWGNEKIPFNKDIITVQEGTRNGAWRNVNISNPKLYVYRSTEPNIKGAALLQVPGGGYANVSLSKDGKSDAKYLLKMGFNVVAVLKYRLPDTAIVYSQEKVPLCDTQKALSLIHKNAENWQIDRTKIAVLGSSAGGHLAASLANLKDTILAPNVQAEEIEQAVSILMFPVISFNLPYRHKSSYMYLLGEKMNNSTLLDYYSMENQISDKTPPTFLVHALNDTSVTYQNSIIYADKLKELGIKHKCLLVDKGGHGFHFDAERTGIDWGRELKIWLLNNTNLLNNTESKNQVK